MSQLVTLHGHLPAVVAASGERAQTRFWEFFVSNIRNPNTRRAYGVIAESVPNCTLRIVPQSSGGFWGRRSVCGRVYGRIFERI